jgi:D-alanyl-D-alanine carboxypeptidase
MLCLPLALAATGEAQAMPAASATARTPVCLPSYQEAVDLVPVGLDVAGRPQRLHPEAAVAWREMLRSAKADGVVLLLVSGFRSVDQQRQIFERKLRAGQTLQAILAVNVPPGFSQHHTGTAVDLGTPGSTDLLEDFEGTAAFRWLRAHAQDHGFWLTYTRGNSSGVAFEPWHWAFLEGAPGQGCRRENAEFYKDFTPISRTPSRLGAASF